MKTRALALLTIAVVAVGLAVLRFGGDDAVKVPDGARAGHLVLEPCSYPTEAGKLAADCGTLVVPENRAKPGSRLIALPVTRIRARTKTAKEPIFRLEGGPGKTNMKFPMASRFAKNRDIVLVGYRGNDGSSVLECPEVASALKRSTDFLGEKSMNAHAGAFRECSTRLSKEGVDLAGYSLTERVEDLETARKALGYKRIDLLSESAGTRTATIYGQRHPASIRRSAMIAVNPPGGFLWDQRTTDAQLARYSKLCTQDAHCRSRTGDLMATMRRDIPDRWLFLPIKESNVRLASFFGLMESMPEAPLNAPTTFDAWLGDPSGFWAMSLLGDLTFPEAFIWGEFAAFGRADANRAATHPSFHGDRDSALGDPLSRFIWGDGRLADSWPAVPDEDAYDEVRPSEVETLLVGGTLDFSTPAERATKGLLPHLPNGKQVVLSELGHTTDFWTYQPEASTRLIGEFLATGAVDDSLYKPRKVDFEPKTSFGFLARAILGTMLAFALITIVSLVWMPRRVYKRGGFGRKASGVLRSVFPLVLGLGGYFAAALIVLSTSPGVPLDGELLSIASVGLPIAAGLYWAWVQRDRPKLIGLVCAVVGTLAGAWLGFHATVGLMTLLTTIAGATAGGNLALLAYDMRARRAVLS